MRLRARKLLAASGAVASPIPAVRSGPAGPGPRALGDFVRRQRGLLLLRLGLPRESQERMGMRLVFRRDEVIDTVRAVGTNAVLLVATLEKLGASVVEGDDLEKRASERGI